MRFNWKFWKSHRSTLEARRKWTAALRSGEYRQGSGALTNVHKNGTEDHCCLGVLCELAVAHGIIPPGRVIRSSMVKEYDGCRSYLPESVQRWAGLPGENPEVSSMYDRRTLAGLNDALVSFDVIANIIDAEFNNG